VKLTPSSRVCAVGAIMCVALTVCSRNLEDRGGPSFLASSAIAGIAYLLAIREFLCTPEFPRRVVLVAIVLAAVWHLPFLWMPSGPDDDIRRYVWDGRLQRLGYNPYVVVPSDPAVRTLHTNETRNLNNPNLPSPYPAGAQLFFRAVTAIHESTFAMKAALIVCDFAIIFVLLDVLRRNARGAHLVLAYAWNPLLAIDVAGSGHIDILGALLLLISFAALGRRARATAAVAFGLAVAVKLLPIVLLPIYWKRVRMRDAALAAAVVGFLYAPFLNELLKQGRVPIGSLLAYVQTFRFNDPVFAQLERAVPQIAAGLPVVVGFVTAIWLRSTSLGLSPAVFAWPMAASLLCAPTVYPWYLLWLLPFLWSASTLPIVVWTVSIIPTYIVWHLRTLGRVWSVPGWVILIEYGSVAMVGAVIALCRLTQRASRYRNTNHPFTEEGC
jgi:alpha-1,6-mannosyltransferase